MADPPNSSATYEDPSTTSLVSTGPRLLSRKTSLACPEGLTLTSGKTVAPLDIAYETFGALSPARDNAILIVHALTGDSHCAGYYGDDPDERPGWWNELIGPGKAFDTQRYFIICSNALGGCSGTTGPPSLSPATGEPYGLSFPVFTIRDMVNTQKLLLDHLGIARLLCVSGGSLGGMNVLDWAVAYPDMVSSIIPVSTCGRLSPQGIGFSEVQRQAIIRDPKWANGAYDPNDPDAQPTHGLAVARMIGNITYRSAESMHRQFGRRRRSEAPPDRFGQRFEIESYLQHMGEKFIDRFDANSYIYLTKAMDFYDIAEGCASLEEAAAGIKCKSLFIAFRSDWLFPPQETEELVEALRAVGREAEYHEVESDYGHDAFLVEYPKYAYLIKRFLERMYRFYNAPEE
jgi:homoserine O-acetyltransferase